MDHKEKSKLVHRLLAGYYKVRLGDVAYYVMSPNAELLYEVADFYDELYEDNKYKDWLTIEQARQHSIREGFWDKDGEKKLEDCEKTIEDKKIKLYETYLTDPNGHKEAADVLVAVRRFQDKLLTTKHSFDHLTLEGYADYHSQCFMFVHLICDADKKPIWTSYRAANQGLLQQIMNKYRESAVNSTSLREISRTEPWRHYWGAQKEGTFIGGVQNDDHRTLILFSKMYDSVYGHPECPSDDIVNNDDMLDGWMALNKRKAEKDKAQKQATTLIPGRIKDSAREVGVVIPHHDGKGRILSKAERDMQAKKIYDLNDTTGKITIKQRESFIKKHGEVSADKLPDTKIELTHQAKEQFKSKLKK